MTNEVGMYRGSFDPPHNGHLEVVEFALKTGLSSVHILFRDANPYKPFRSNETVREELLKKMFVNFPNVIVSNKFHKEVFTELENNPTIQKIHLIIGTDLLSVPFPPVKTPTKIHYFILPRLGFPHEDTLTVWNGAPAKIYDVSHLSERYYSSSQLRFLLFQKKFEEAKQGFKEDFFHHLLQQKLYLPTENEEKFAPLLQEVKREVEEEIVVKNLVTVDMFPLSFHLAQDLGIKELSCDLICFIKNKEGESVLVVKIFLGDHYIERYTNERLAFEKTSQLYFSHERENYAFIGFINS